MEYLRSSLMCSYWMAKEIKKMHEDEKNLRLNKNEIAREFYDDETLKKIAQELTDAIRRNITIDFNVRSQAQATMRTIIRRLLKKYDYPPEQAKEALNIVMKQVELMCSNEAETYGEVEKGLPKAAEKEERYTY